jgi:RimJ/RimL family protein N-acetyltransferase
MIRLEPMWEEDFRAFLDRAIPRRAASWVERGIWTEAESLEASRQRYARLLPNGHETPGHHFLNVVESEGGAPVGEIWYTAEPQGGKVQVWIEWILIEPAFRRKGYAAQALRIVEETARGLGAERIGLTVWTDNPGARSLYSKLGYAEASVNMAKSLDPTR